MAELSPGSVLAGRRVESEVVDTIDVGDGPEGITVSRISPDGDVNTVPVGDGPVQVAVTDDDRVWVTLSKADEVAELNRDSGELAGHAASVPGQPRGIAFDGERLWVSVTTGGYLAVFRPDNHDDVRRVRGIRGPREIRFGLGAVWVTTGSNERLIALDPDSRKQIDSFRVGPLTYGLAVSDRAAWAASEGTGRLVKVAPQE